MSLVVLFRFGRAFLPFVHRSSLASVSPLITHHRPGITHAIVQ